MEQKIESADNLRLYRTIAYPQLTKMAAQNSVKETSTKLGTRNHGTVSGFN